MDTFKTYFIPPNRAINPPIFTTDRSVSFIKEMGSGSYGEVYKGELNGFSVAVKRNIIEKTVDMLGCIRELDILSRCKHPFIVDLLAVFVGNPFKNYTLPEITRFKIENGMMNMNNPVKVPAPNLKEDPLFFAFEAAEYDFQSSIYNVKGKSWSFTKKAMLQLLIGLKWLKAKKIIHRDLKPSNLLWQRCGNESFLKICDFGMSKFQYETGKKSSRVVTSWYRAPEISFGYSYSYPSDMWSVGCIFYEIVVQQALNSNIKDNDVDLLNHSLSMISEIPTVELVKKLNKNNLVLDPKIYAPRNNISSILNCRGNDNLKDYYANFDTDGLGTREQFADLLNKILVLDPNLRYTPEQCLNHPFFYSFRRYVEDVEKLYPPVEDEYEPVNIVPCKDREKAVYICYCIFDQREKYPWYKHQIIFHSLELFDKYLSYLQMTNHPYYEVGPTKEESSYESAQLTLFKFMVCIYICIKYFTITKVTISFKDIVVSDFHTQEYFDLAREFETGLIMKLLKYKIYRPTVLEASDYYRTILSDLDVKYMLMYYGNIKSGVFKDYRELFPKYKEFERIKMEEKRLRLLTQKPEEFTSVPGKTELDLNKEVNPSNGVKVEINPNISKVENVVNTSKVETIPNTFKVETIPSNGIRAETNPGNGVRVETNPNNPILINKSVSSGLYYNRENKPIHSTLVYNPENKTSPTGIVNDPSNIQSVPQFITKPEFVPGDKNSDVNIFPIPGKANTPIIDSTGKAVKILTTPKQIKMEEKEIPISIRPTNNVVYTTQKKYTPSEISPGISSPNTGTIMEEITGNKNTSPIIDIIKK